MNPASRLAAAALAALVVSTPAYAHHVMDNAMPATLLQGLLSGLAHPVIGLDHLAFIVAAGVLAARYSNGLLLALVFVIASVVGAAVHVGGVDLPGGEWWIAATLLLVAVLMIRRSPGEALPLSVFYALAGYVHGYALAESIVGAETTPLIAYFAGLAIVQAAIAVAACAATRALMRRRPALPLLRAAGAAAGVAGVAVLLLNLA